MDIQTLRVISPPCGENEALLRSNHLSRARSAPKSDRGIWTCPRLLALPSLSILWRETSKDGSFSPATSKKKTSFHSGPELVSFVKLRCRCSECVSSA
eukprot:745997-Hanusia_phi.AAC.3